MFVVAMMIRHFFCFATNLSAAISVKVIPPMKYTTTVFGFVADCKLPPPFALLMHGLPKCSPGSILRTSSIPFQPSRSIACSASLEINNFFINKFVVLKKVRSKLYYYNYTRFFFWKFKTINSCSALYYVDDSKCRLKSDSVVKTYFLCYSYAFS